MPRQPRECSVCNDRGMWRGDTCRTCLRRLRVLDTGRLTADASWRPRHYPPMCPNCRGFPYLPVDHGYTRCRACSAHPGHAMSFADWDKERAT